MSTYGNILKARDTLTINDRYEFAVVPDFFDHNRAKVEGCKLRIFKNDTLVNFTTNINPMGNTFLITVLPTKVGNYNIIGSFIQ